MLLIFFSVERKRFELSIQLPIYYLSRVAPSTTRTPLCVVVRGAKIGFMGLNANTFLKTQLSSERICQHLLAFRHILFFSKYIHHLSDRGFGGDVGAAYYACLFEEAAGFVMALGYAAAVALGYVENDDVSVDRVADGVEEPLGSGGVAGSVGFQYYAF